MTAAQAHDQPMCTALMAGSAAIVGGGFLLFATARSNLAELLAATGVLGFGVGSFSAAMPGVNP